MKTNVGILYFKLTCFTSDAVHLHDEFYSMGRSDLMFNSRNTMTGSQVITSFYVFSRHESLTQTDVMDCVLTRELLIMKMKTSTGQLTGVPCTLITTRLELAQTEE